MSRSQDPNQERNVTRRDLLKFVGAVAGGAAMYNAMHSLGFAAASTYQGPMQLQGTPKDASVLILGAGVAGMVAAYELRKAGYKVTVLEYREKAGGRCWTLRGGDDYTELGGFSQECRIDAPGAYFNPGPWRIPYHHYGVLDYCRLLGVELETFVQLNMNAYYHNPEAFGGKPQRIRWVLSDTQGYISELLAKAANQNQLDQRLGEEDKAVLLDALKSWGALDKNYRYAASPHVSARRGYDVDPGGGLMPRAKDSTPLGLDDLLRSQLWVFANQFMEYEYQQTIFEPKGGMDMIAQAFAKELGNLITYNCKVSKIRQNDGGVTATYTDTKSGREKQVSAHWCVCTIPLSILSQMEMDVSKEMKRAIDAVPYETGFKAAAQFKRRFWEEDDRIFGGITYTTLPLRNISYPVYGMNKGGKGVLLACYTFGPDSYKLTAMEPEPRLKKVLEWGRQIHPQYDREFENGISVGWHRVPWSLGCHGIWTEETRAKYYDTLCAIDGRLVLAGEHCSFWPAWLEGSVLSAMNATERLHARAMNR